MTYERDLPVLVKSVSRRLRSAWTKKVRREMTERAQPRVPTDRVERGPRS